MWAASKVKDDSHSSENGLVAVAIDKDKGSQHALKWAVDHLVNKGDTIILIHVKNRPNALPNSNGTISDGKEDSKAVSKEIFLPFRCFCTRKDIQCKDVVLEDGDVSKAIMEYVTQQAIEILVLGAPTRNAFLRRLKTTDIPSAISKGAPDFCTVYIISKGKISSVRSAIRSAPAASPLRAQIQNQSSIKCEPAAGGPFANSAKVETPRLRTQQEIDSIKSPFSRGGRGVNTKSYGDLMFPDSDISFVSSGRPSTDRMSPSIYDHLDSTKTPRMTHEDHYYMDRSFESAPTPRRSFGQDSHESSGPLWSPQVMEDVEAEMKRLKLELKQTMDMYSNACKEALTAKQKARELHHWKMEEEQRLEEARMAGEAAMAIAERERTKCRAAIEAAEASQRLAELEGQRRMQAELKALKETEEKTKALDALAQSDVRYRKYTIEEIEIATDAFADSRKIGEGGYGPVYKGHLDHTAVAIKVLRPDAAQGRSQFQKEV